MSKMKWPEWVYKHDHADGYVVHCARYNNVGEVGIAIVAVIGMWGDRPFDWTAYIGSSVRGAEREIWAIQDAVRSGNKLSRDDAQHFFPDLPTAFWRA